MQTQLRRSLTWDQGVELLGDLVEALLVRPGEALSLREVLARRPFVFSFEPRCHGRSRKTLGFASPAEKL